MTQEFVTLRRGVVEQALAALDSSKVWKTLNLHKLKAPHVSDAAAALRAALEQPQGDQQPRYLDGGSRYKVTHLKTSGHCIIGLPEELLGQWVALVDATDNKHMAGQRTPVLEQSDVRIRTSVPEGRKPVPVEPTIKMVSEGSCAAALPGHRYIDESAAKKCWAYMLDAAPQPPVAEQPQLVEMLGETCIDGGKCHHKCTDRCFRRECCAPFSDYSGPWKYEQTQPQGEQEPVGKLISDPYEGHIFVPYGDRWPFNEDLYTRPQPKREPLTDEQIERAWQFLHDEEGNPPDQHDFARAIEAAHNIK